MHLADHACIFVSVTSLLLDSPVPALFGRLGSFDLITLATLATLATRATRVYLRRFVCVDWYTNTDPNNRPGEIKVTAESVIALLLPGLPEFVA